VPDIKLRMIPRKIWILGGSGIIGRSLFTAAKIHGPSMGMSCELLNVRLNDNSSIETASFGKGDIVFLLAAISSPDVCRDEYEKAKEVNVLGTSILIQRIIAFGARVVFFSSDTIYGERDDEFDETAASNPAGEYAKMKSLVERRFSGNASFKAIRLSYVFSREDKFTRYLADCVERHEEADLFHPFYRSIVHRDDVIEGLLALAMCWDEVPEQFINFGGPQVVSRIDFAECLREVYFHDMHYKVTKPDADFFKNRPRVIAMTSPVFTRLLGRSSRSLCEAAHLEFSSFSTTGRVI
jgi:dTDP-4-dehydrorhamnose reductase